MPVKYVERPDGTMVFEGDDDCDLRLALSNGSECGGNLLDLFVLVNGAMHHLGMDQLPFDARQLMTDAMMRMMQPDGFVSRIAPDAQDILSDAAEAMSEDLLALWAWVKVAITRYVNGHIKGASDSLPQVIQDIVLYRSEEGIRVNERNGDRMILSRAEVDPGANLHVGAYVSEIDFCLLYTSPSPRDGLLSRMPSSA